MAKLDGQGGGQRNPNGRDVEGNLPGMALDRPWLGGDRLGARMGGGRDDIARDGSGSTLHPSNDHISQSIHPHISESGGSNPLFVVKPQVRDPHLVGRWDGNDVALLMLDSTGDGPIHGGVAWRVESRDDSELEPDAVGCRGARPRAGPRCRRTDDPIEGGRTTDEVAAEAEDQPRGHLLRCQCRRMRRGRGRRRCRRLRRGRGRRRCRRLRRGRGRRRCGCRLRRGRGIRRRWRRLRRGPGEASMRMAWVRRGHCRALVVGCGVAGGRRATRHSGGGRYTSGSGKSLRESPGPCPFPFGKAHSGSSRTGASMALRMNRALTGSAPMALSRMEYTPGWSQARFEPLRAPGEPGSSWDVPSGPMRVIASAPRSTGPGMCRTKGR